MSTRKTQPRCSETPRTGGKGNTRNKPPTPKVSLAPASSPTTSFNLQIDSGYMGPSRALQPDLSIQCDIAYSNYMRALLTQNIVQDTILNYDDAIDDQLAQQARALRKVKVEENKLANEIKDLQLQLEIKKLYLELKQTSGCIDEVLHDYKVDENLSNYIAFCESACNKLYLKNIKPFESQQDYDKFTELLEKCADSAKKLNRVIGNTKATETLGEHLKKFLELQNEFINKQKLLHDLKSTVNLMLYKTASDKFAEK